MNRASDVMTTNPLTVGNLLTVQALAQTLLEHAAEGAVVLHDDRVVGVVTATDLAIRLLSERFTATADPDAIASNRKRAAVLVEELMTRAPVTVGPDSPITEVARIMGLDGRSLIPVMRDGVLVGAITRRSIIAAAAADGVSPRDELRK